MCERQRFTIRTSDEIISRIEALAGISGESKNSVANVLLAMQLSDVTCGATVGAKQNKRVSSPTTPSSQKKKDIPKGISKKEKVSLGNGRKPKDFEECLEYFKQRRIPDPEQKARDFYDFYEAKGWVVGKSPIKKWSCCLTTWLSHNPDWQPVEEIKTNDLVLEEVLGWMQKEHPEWHEKFKKAKTVNEIDGFYIDEFRGR